MKKLLALPFLTLSLHLPSALAEPATTDSVKQLMETTGSTQMSRQIVQQMIPMLKNWCRMHRMISGTVL